MTYIALSLGEQTFSKDPNGENHPSPGEKRMVFELKSTVKMVLKVVSI